MNVSLPNGHEILVRRPEPGDAINLLSYFNDLSAGTRQRFGPHPFDEATVNHICHHPDDNVYRYIAIDPVKGNIIAYMLLKKGMTEGDQHRYAQRNQFFDPAMTVTFAPSVADNWQSSGVGSAMYGCIENELRSKGTRQIILWGGVQATNEKAVNFYKKHHYQHAGSFWHDGKDNYDMLKWL